MPDPARIGRWTVAGSDSAPVYIYIYISVNHEADVCIYIYIYIFQKTPSA